MSQERVGTWLAQPGGYRAFLPARLPPTPPIDEAALDSRLSHCEGAVAALAENADRIPLQEFAALMMKVEALASCAIEGVEASLGDVIDSSRASAESAVVHDALAAFEIGKRRATRIDLDLVRAIHDRVLGDGGSFRLQQNFVAGAGVRDIADAIFIPPPAADVLPALENWMHWQAQASSHPLVVAGVAHAHFLTIHPFDDGNGRVCRILTGLIMLSRETVREPVIALSVALARNRNRYYEALTSLRDSGDWEAWLEFFLSRVAEAADAARDAALAVATAGEVKLEAFRSLTRFPKYEASQVTGIHDQRKE